MKFSFKKGDGGEKKPKASKRKARSGGDGLASAKAFVAKHGEKLLLGVIAVASLYVVYAGFNKDGLDSNPDDIDAAIRSANNRIDANTWSEVKATRYAEVDRFDQQATADLVNIDAKSFEMPMPMHPVLQAQRKRRTDPELVAPLELEVRPGYGPLAVNDEGRGGGGISDMLNSNDESRPLPDKYHKIKGESRSGGVTESRFFVSLTGLVPVRQQQERFKDALAGAIEYAPERDSPKYVAMAIERREIQPNGQPTEWQDLKARITMRDRPKKWDGKGDEVADSDHLIESLVMSLPPLVFRDVAEWAVHSKIPVIVDRDNYQDNSADSEPQDEDDDGFDIFDSRPREGDDESNKDGEFSQADEFLDQMQVEFGLLRYFDFDVQPGATYEYRVQVWLEDPNNPFESSRPSNTACEPDVTVRRQAKPSVHYVMSPWSQASQPVVVPSGRSVYVGKVVAPKTRQVNSRINLPSGKSDEPDATVIAVTWNAEKAMDVPAELNVKRGSVINGTRDVEAVDPAKGRVIPLKGYRFATNSLVLDIAGGEVLGRQGREEIRAPGVLLLMDELGKIHYHDELGDYSDFDFFTIPPEEDDTFGQPQVDEGGDERTKEGRESRRNRENRRNEEEAQGDELRGGRRRPR